MFALDVSKGFISSSMNAETVVTSQVPVWCQVSLPYVSCLLRADLLQKVLGHISHVNEVRLDEN